ncbi:uncharacterized protein [Elaeis guineensis]|uniref:Uncharacterized protein LOC105042942 n=1 Tax=Elaeis guineensis var. tenera TaxID=51953 RepID=A0A6I9R0V3_ELAGV|nr:uncharacterized protein LOC105042942 [Elaeis guineensis]
MEAGRRTAVVEAWTPPYCTVVGVDTSGGFWYRACSNCERTLPDDHRNPNSNPTCRLCSQRTFAPPSKRLYRLLVSIATVDKVMVVVCFDRAARVLMGCSADEFVDFCRAHPLAAEKAAEVLEGEMCRMTLSPSKKGNAEHLRVAAVEPLRTGFRPVIETLRKMYGVGTSKTKS